MAIVVNHDNTIHGILTLFMCTGDLESVLKKACQSIGLGDDDDGTAFGWSLKLSWACHISQDIVKLHAIPHWPGTAYRLPPYGSLR